MVTTSEAIETLAQEAQLNVPFRSNNHLNRKQEDASDDNSNTPDLDLNDHGNPIPT